MIRPEAQDGQHDFDFLSGSWNVHHRRLTKRLVGSDDWAEFGGTTQVRPILGGLGNFDENRIDLPSDPYQACTLRLFDPGRGLWSIYWIDGRKLDLDPPMAGSFRDGIGKFFGDDQYDGQPIKIRFLWTMEQPDAPRWEQAFSVDDGASWETNWIMEFTRSS